MTEIQLDRNSDIPLYAQIKAAIKKDIMHNVLKPGDKIPTVNALSGKLNVTQATILRAYEDLVRENLIVSFVGRGTFITDDKKPEQHSHSSLPFTRSPLEPVDPEFALAARRLRMGIASSLEALQVLVNRPGIIHFTAGIPDPVIADPGILQKCINLALARGQEAYQHYSPPCGMDALRQEIAGRFKKKGLAVTKDNVLITSGSQQAVAILAQVALENRYRIICESPCYMGIARAFGSIGHWVESLARDEEGPIPDKFKRFYDNRSSLLYLCTKLHNPMGTDIGKERVKMVADWAVRHDSLVISDEIFDDLYFDNKNHPVFYDQFGEGRTIVIGSVSKSFMCGIRLGWLIASADKIRNFVSFRRAIDLGSPPLMQGITLALFQSGEYDRHIKKAREHYRIRRDAMLAALQKHMPDGVRWTTPGGGMHMWAELPAGYSSIALFLLAIERGVAIGPGPQMDIDHRFINGFKISYGSVLPQQIEEGIELLADAVKALFQFPPGDAGLTGLGDFL